MTTDKYGKPLERIKKEKGTIVIYWHKTFREIGFNIHFSDGHDWYGGTFREIEKCYEIAYSVYEKYTQNN